MRRIMSAKVSLSLKRGCKGRVTVATNLAGRGVDIKLGGVPADPVEREEVLALGGLAVIANRFHPPASALV